MANIRILLIEDNRILREGILVMLQRLGDFAVTAVPDGRQASLTKARARLPA